MAVTNERSISDVRLQQLISKLQELFFGGPPVSKFTGGIRRSKACKLCSHLFTVISHH